MSVQLQNADSSLVDQTVGQLVANRPSRARVFERMGIDYCCGGKLPLADACTHKGLDVAAVLGELLASDQNVTAPEQDWSHATLTELADHIEATHHAYLKAELPHLETWLAKIAGKHGAKHPQLLQVHQVFVGLKAELTDHLMKEEQILFPLCRSLDQARHTGHTVESHCGSVANPIRVMVMEHDDAGAALARLRQLTDGYKAPADACNTFRAAMAGLAELEADLHRHIHKENSILFPRAIELEAS